MLVDLFGARRARVAVSLVLLLLLAASSASAFLPMSPTEVLALDEDDKRGGDKPGGKIDEGDGAARGDSKQKPEKDKSGKDKSGKVDDESDFVTAVPTSTPARQAEPTAEPTMGALTPVSSPTETATPPATTGTLVIRLRACPDGTDPAVGTDALREACLDGEADAEFELAGRSGLFNGWRRDIATDDDGDARVSRLAEGTYSLTLDELDWCAAEASSVDDGLIVIEPAETTEVTAYLCGEPAPSTPAGS